MLVHTDDFISSVLLGISTIAKIFRRTTNVCFLWKDNSAADNKWTNACKVLTKQAKSPKQSSFSLSEVIFCFHVTGNEQTGQNWLITSLWLYEKQSIWTDNLSTNRLTHCEHVFVVISTSLPNWSVLVRDLVCLGGNTSAVLFLSNKVTLFKWVFDTSLHLFF